MNGFDYQSQQAMSANHRYPAETAADFTICRNAKAAQMIVCSCNALREAQVREIARDGVSGALEAYQRLGCRPQCGQCMPYAREIVREESSRVSS